MDAITANLEGMRGPCGRLPKQLALKVLGAPLHLISRRLLVPPKTSRWAFYNAYLSALDEVDRPPEYVTAAMLPQFTTKQRRAYSVWHHTLVARSVADELFALNQLREAGVLEEALKIPRSPAVESLVQSTIFARISARYCQVSSKETQRQKSRKIPANRTAVLGVVCLRIRKEGNNDNQVHVAAAAYLNEGATKNAPDGLDRDTIRREDLKFRAAVKSGGLLYFREAVAINVRLVEIEKKAHVTPRFRGLKGVALFDAIAHLSDPIEGFLKKFVIPDTFDAPLRASR